MSSYSVRSSRPCQWVEPRPYQDTSLRLMKHGRILPMEQEERGIFRRLLGRI